MLEAGGWRMEDARNTALQFKKERCGSQPPQGARASPPGVPTRPVERPSLVWAKACSMQLGLSKKVGGSEVADGAAASSARLLRA